MTTTTTYSDENDFELYLVPEPFHGETEVEAENGPSRGNPTLEAVARWLVREIISRTGQRSPFELTDIAFTIMHPELGGRRIKKGETALIADYNRIKKEIVETALAEGSGSQSAGGGTMSPQAPAGGATYAAPPPLGGDAEPKGYKPVWRKRSSDGVKVKRGLARYSGDRLETTVRALMKKGIVSVTEENLDTFQRIANVESDGGIQALNTWDSGVVSIGFFQFTLQHGKVQRWIRRAPDAFRRFGIELDEGRKYKIGDETPVAIKGAPTPAELRWDGWAERFYLAGLDPEIIAAELDLGKIVLDEGLKSAKRYLKEIAGGFDLFAKAYSASLPLRGLYQEALNNKPVGARNGIRLAAKRALQEGTTDAGRFYEIAKKAIVDAFVALDDRSSGEHIVQRTAVGLKGR